MTKFIVGSSSDRLYQALYDAGVVAERPDDVARLVIDLRVGHPAKLYVEKFADTALTDVLLAGLINLDDEPIARSGPPEAPRARPPSAPRWVKPGQTTTAEAAP